jgi:hypothetical protein
MDVYMFTVKSLVCLPWAIVFSGWPVYFLTSKKRREYQLGWKKWAMRAWFVLGLLLAWHSVDGPLPAGELAAMNAMSTSEKFLTLSRTLELWVMFAIMFGGWPYYFIRCHPGTPWLGKSCLGYVSWMLPFLLTPNHQSEYMHPMEFLWYLAMVVPFVLVLVTALIRRWRPSDKHRHRQPADA